MLRLKIDLDYNKGAINISSLEIKFSQGEENPSGFYLAEIIDYNDETLNLSFFGIPNEILVDETDPRTGEISGGGLKVLDKVSFEIYLPYYKNAKEIVIYDKNITELARISVWEYSKERAEEIISEEGIVKEEAQKEQKIETKTEIERGKETFIKGLEKYTGYWWVLIVVIIVLLVILFYSLQKKR